MSFLTSNNTRRNSFEDLQSICHKQTNNDKELSLQQSPNINIFNVPFKVCHHFARSIHPVSTTCRSIIRIVFKTSQKFWLLPPSCNKQHKSLQQCIYWKPYILQSTKNIIETICFTMKTTHWVLTSYTKTM